MSAELPAYVTVTDAAGRVLFRRLATAAEIEEAIQIARAADGEAEQVLKRIAKDRDKVLSAQAKRAQAEADAKAEPVIQVVEAGVVTEPQDEPFMTTEHLPEFEGDSTFPDFVESSAPIHQEPKEGKDAFTAFGDDELDFLGALDEEKGKRAL
ncbi:MAG TPA: hypothetical protein VGG22_12525 [Candidatus Baltobacteraceae bacterium]